MLFLGPCPAGYKKASGYMNQVELYGDNKIGTGIETDREGCGKACDERPECCSIELNEEEGTCNINRLCSPDTRQPKKFVFCSKGIK